MRTILILSDSQEFREGSVRYGIELARRMGARLMLLALLERKGAANTMQAMRPELEQTLKGFVGSSAEAGVPASAFVRMGPPGTELFKHLAGEKTPEAVVWAGRGGISARAGQRRLRLHKALKSLGCPVLVPATRT